ncbi:hypothetical protein [Streptomyces sp. NBC_01431]|uniref:hypothetical protein n=1 Tax=Streptomyces sp. NBC_01431 TaxID=2903863 RepID=UPI002E344EFB|nr:hypothetical protein [Streptomyces sp. NBC_01431]
MRPTPRSRLWHPRHAALVLVEGHESAQANSLDPLADDRLAFRANSVGRDLTHAVTAAHNSRCHQRTVVNAAHSVNVLATATMPTEYPGAQLSVVAPTPPRLPQPYTGS